MSTFTLPMALFVSNYLAGSVTLGNSHVIVGVLGFSLLIATLGIILSIEPTPAHRARLAATRPALQH
ncbi:MAG TPA: hypothetical protein VL403_20715 [Candidatus Kryptonia bacterium]|nr:hypothetical protein [Candidatus Kryptonia bacterium]